MLRCPDTGLVAVLLPRISNPASDASDRCHGRGRLEVGPAAVQPSVLAVNFGLVCHGSGLKSAFQ